MMIKVCGITRREDAQAAVEAGASALGFIFYPKSPRYVTPEAAAALAEGLATLKVGVFVDESPAAIESVMRAAKLDVAQIYGDAIPENTRVWKAFRPAASVATDGAEAILLDGPANGISFNWAVARDLNHKVIVAGGLDASNVADAIRIAKPWGVDASSKLESAPGIKDHQKIRAFVKAAQEAK
ncbi:MAG: phosphoribosylanthranilate isomerase [Bryobacteraceae bacterium]|jgi:phosphoribosylanthranilate isomerase